MARVGIGVPVFNAGEHLAASLECLRKQTFEDIEVIISDNCSTDTTGDICKEFVARDARFSYIRQPENIGMIANFIATRQTSSAPLFMWRAYDDLSAPNYVEELVKCFDQNPGIGLAVGDVRSFVDDKNRERRIAFRPRSARHRVIGIIQHLFSSHASWIYGLWDRDCLAKIQDKVHLEYPHAWGWDHLAFLPLILEDRIVGTNRTFFKQQIFRSHSTRAERRAKRPSNSLLRELRSDYDRAAREAIDRCVWTPLEKRLLLSVLPFYVDRRGYSRFRLFKGSLRERVKGNRS